MNVLKKVYCRVFQTVFKLAIPLLPYRLPKIIDSVEELPDLLLRQKRKADRPLIITDAGIVKLGLIEPLCTALKQHNIELAIYDRTVPNPTTATVEEALAVYNENKCNAIIGFGGGSSMDCAKACGIRVVKPKKHLSKLKGILKVCKRLPLIVAIPTTAGTGSETTLAAVITDAETRHKYAINDFPLIPSYAVLDAKVTLDLPPSITATTGMDALTHAVEAFIGRSTTTDTRAQAISAVKLIFENLDKAFTNGHDELARKNMLKAAFDAGCAFTKSYVGYVHAVAHSLGGKYNVPHGLANAVLLPFVLECYGSAVYGKLRTLAVASGVASESDSREDASKKFIDAIKNMKKRFGIGDVFAELKKEDISELATYADKEANPLYPVPVLMDKKELEKIYYMVMQK